MNKLILTGLLAIACLLTTPPASFAQDEMPNGFNTLLVLEAYLGGEETELFDMGMSYCNEYEPELVANPVCNGFLEWDGVDFWTGMEYTATDDYGSWEASYGISGALSIENSMELDGMEVPYLDYLTVAADVLWYDDEGQVTGQTWYYTIYDVPPAFEPSSGLYSEWYGEPPLDSLTYTVELADEDEVLMNIGELYNGLSMVDENNPEYDFFDEFDLASVVAAEFNLVLFYVE